LFDLFDTSGDGLVSFEEFQHALKAEMELLEVQDHFEVVEGDDAEARKKEQAAIMGAMHRGVRINRSASVEGDVKMQGNAEMMSRAVGRHSHCRFCKHQCKILSNTEHKLNTDARAKLSSTANSYFS
jgi:hypothetical protein